TASDASSVVVGETASARLTPASACRSQRNASLSTEKIACVLDFAGKGDSPEWAIRQRIPSWLRPSSAQPGTKHSWLFTTRPPKAEETGMRGRMTTRSDDTAAVVGQLRSRS